LEPTSTSSKTTTSVGPGELEVGLDQPGHQRGSTGALAYWSVDDAAASLQALIDAGAEKVQDATDIGYGKVIAIARDFAGNCVYS